MKESKGYLAQRSARAYASLAPSAVELERVAAESLDLAEGLTRGFFRPAEEEPLRLWFARFLTVREGLWEVIQEASEGVSAGLEGMDTTEDRRLFLLAYGAACCVVRMDRFLVDDLATHRLIQRKLNEPSAELRIPAKQLTRIYRSLSSPRKARRLRSAMAWAESHSRELRALAGDPVVGFIARELDHLEETLDRSKRRFLRILLRYREHSWRRRGASARQKASFAVLESSGRIVSTLKDRWQAKRVTPDVLRSIDSLLRPGDVLVTRHDHAFSNLFLPGFWPHAALYVGSEEDRHQLGVKVDEDRAAKWSGPRRVLEALKDGVLFRSLEETLAVDAMVLIRPRLERPDVAVALGRAAVHEGKLYNFDFDFFRSDRLVCTEVVYRAYDGIGGVRIPLQHRSGRPTLSAEDLLTLALQGKGFEPVALYGAKDCPPELLTGDAARQALAASF
ncbi:MAG: hypothetical protein K0U98_17845 [Deltaproteobacteria bacterium]|nr:hypothetical protein [Deltaproteobacteria bacterium]